jgi:16S rRNA (adenine1518-N6/adenine1519-N6)-dimethyltransferase
MKKIIPKTKIGQHFLNNPKIFSLFINALPDNVLVVEVGAGPGQLTELLAQKSKEVYAVEIDYQFQPILKKLENKYLNLNIIFENILKLDLSQFKNCWFVGNLPYHIIEPLIRKLIHINFPGALFFVGKKFVDLKKDIKLSLAVKSFFHLDVLSWVSKDNFNPPPRTESALIILKPFKKNKYEKNKNIFLLRQLFLTSHSSPLIKNILFRSLINYFYKIKGRNLTKNEARQKIKEYKLPKSILEKPFEQLNKKEYLILSKKFNV